MIDVVEKKVGLPSKEISSDSNKDDATVPDDGVHLLPYIVFPENGSIVGFELNVKTEGGLRFQVCEQEKFEISCCVSP